jgi:hypothetical protein
LLQSYLEKDPHLVRCPKESCQTPLIHEATSPMIVCPNPACRFCFCKNCKVGGDTDALRRGSGVHVAVTVCCASRGLAAQVEWHSDATCEQYQQWKKDNGAAEDLFAKWAELNTKPCPKAEGGCGRSIQKNGGCNHMTYAHCCCIILNSDVRAPFGVINCPDLLLVFGLVPSGAPSAVSSSVGCVGRLTNPGTSPQKAHATASSSRSRGNMKNRNSLSYCAAAWCCCSWSHRHRTTQS